MAATFASPSAVVGLGSGSLSSPSRISSPRKSALAQLETLWGSQALVEESSCGDWLRKDLNVIGFGLNRVASTVKHTGNWWQEPGLGSSSRASGLSLLTSPTPLRSLLNPPDLLFPSYMVLTRYLLLDCVL
ncbi:hypothetical protein NC652_011914 [Populus alba x Populus x berolinensis]|nr:hypothetical protein NC652_011914 [Populus alba x Populus x berolinensis]